MSLDPDGQLLMLNQLAMTVMPSDQDLQDEVR